jgi:hypothetical protein
MRKPRPQDFDPDYIDKDSALKPEPIDVSGVVPIKEKTPATEKIYERTDKRTDDRSENRTELRTEIRSVALPVKRITKRYSFEFFEDQITSLKGIKYRIEMTGERIALSVMVREALDAYLEKHKGE